MADGTWACSSCTFANEAGAEVCEICGAARPGSWSCASCTLLNPQQLEVCNACGHPRAPKRRPKKGEAWRSADHLLTPSSYSAAPARTTTVPRRPVRAVPQKGDFVRGSCRLVLDPCLESASSAAISALTGVGLWDKVWRVDMPCEELPACPICLEVPQLSRAPQCWHVLCLPCALRHMRASQSSQTSKKSQGFPALSQSGASNSCKCPVCGKGMTLEGLKPVNLKLQQLPKPENCQQLTFQLVRRTGESFLSLASSGGPRQDHLCLPREGDPGALFARRVLGDP